MNLNNFNLDNYDLISFDIWDTCIRRDVHPDTIKMYMSNYIIINYRKYIVEEYKDSSSLFHLRQSIENEIGQQNMKSGFDNEYKIYDVYNFLLNHVCKELEITERVINKLIDIELEAEERVIYKDPLIEDILKKAKNKRIIFISDFYMSEEHIYRLLNKLNLGKYFEQGYSSSTYLKNKHCGSLFERVIEIENIDYKKLFHIGDNLHSDVNIPKSKGINVLHYIPKNEHSLRKERESLFNNNNAMINLLNKDLSNTSEQKYLDKTEKELYRYGMNIAPFFTFYLIHIIKDCIKKDIKKIYFFTREGEFYKDIYDIVRKINIFNINKEFYPESEILDVSRVATFSPSLKSFSIKELMRIWNQYSNQSMKALFKSLNIFIDSNIQLFLAKYGIEENEIIIFPWEDKRVISLFDNKDFIKYIENILTEKKNILNQYLEEKTFFENKKLAIVDIGWRGTIQDNLSNMTNQKIYGYYLGLNRFLNKQPKNSKKNGFAIDLNNNNNLEKEFLLHLVSPLEMISNSKTGSTVDYQIKDNYVIAKKNIDTFENKIYDKYIKHLQSGVLNNVQQIAEFYKKHQISENNLVSISLMYWEEIILKPNKYIVKAFFELNHNEEFGVGSFVENSEKVKIKKLLKDKNIKKFLKDTGWPEGYLTYKNLSYLLPILNKFKKYYANKRNKQFYKSPQEYEQIINEQKSMILERWESMQNMERMIIERDKYIKELEKKLYEK